MSVESSDDEPTKAVGTMTSVTAMDTFAMITMGTKITRMTTSTARCPRSLFLRRMSRQVTMVWMFVCTASDMTDIIRTAKTVSRTGASVGFCTLASGTASR